MCLIPRIAFALAVLLCVPQFSWAWGKDGHEIVGKVAEKSLSEKAKTAIDELLKDDQFKTIGDSRLVNWADFIRNAAMFKKKFPNNDKFHYLDIDVESDLATVSVAKSAEEGENAYKTVLRFQKVLQDPDAEVQEKRYALFFICHIIGDLHQPLHCAERTNDKGGNLCQVYLPGKTEKADKINLHKVWDTTMVERAMSPLTPADYVAKLIDSIEPEAKKKYQAGTLDDWVLDGHKIARESVYAGVPKSSQTGDTFPLKAEYMDAGAAVVRLQLLKGGLRLAAFLNDTYKE